MARRTTNDRLTAAREAETNAKARVRELEAQVRAAERRRDTRQRIVLGGLMLKAARDGREPDGRWAAELVARMDARDRELFVGERWLVAPEENYDEPSETNGDRARGDSQTLRNA